MKQELLPFNLEEALNNPDRVVYRNGEKPLEWHWFEHMPTEACIVSIRNGQYWTNNKLGFYNNDESGCLVDLFLLPPPEKRYWVNVYNLNGKLEVGDIYDSEQKAQRVVTANKDYIKTISFTI